LAFLIQLKKRKRRLKKLNLIFILLFLVSLNYISKIFVNIAAKGSLYNLAINLIFGLFLALLVIVLLKFSNYKKSSFLNILILSQGLIFYFLLTQPRLFDKLILAAFYFTGIFLFFTGKKKYDIYFPLFILFLAIFFEVSGLLLFEKNFLYLSVLKNFLIVTAGYTTGSIIFKN